MSASRPWLFRDLALAHRWPRSAFLALTLGCFIANILHTSIKIVPNHQHATNVLDEPTSDDRLELRKDSWCLQHQSKILSVSRVADQQVQLNQPSTRQCGRLRRRTLWLDGYDLQSEVARNIRAQQSNCSAEVATLQLDNDFGLGSHLYQWSQACCSADELGYRIQTFNPQWLWLDQEYCSSRIAQQSPFLCYFPGMESLCGVEQQHLNKVNVTSPHNKRLGCRKARNDEKLPLLRAGSIEYIFSNLSSLVVQEAERQVALLFGKNPVPDDLISVHIRYGDKFWEMDLAPVEEYIQAISNLLNIRGRHWNDTAHIYLATEDPRAHEEFMAAVPSSWNVYVDRTITELSSFRPNKGNRASWTTRNTQGRAGLMTLGSLLIALEANDFVLTTKSNWSRLLNDLRTTVLDPRCDYCTNVMDLRPGLW
jgi:hypothetical protein